MTCQRIHGLRGDVCEAVRAAYALLMEFERSRRW